MAGPTWKDQRMAQIHMLGKNSGGPREGILCGSPIDVEFPPHNDVSMAWIYPAKEFEACLIVCHYLMYADPPAFK